MNDAEPAAQSVEQKEPTGISLNSGEALDLDQASEVMAEARAVVVTLAGPVQAGKTTLLAALFEGFLDGDFKLQQFRGSRTLVGFEQRCFRARWKSGAAEPDTVRTPLSAPGILLHLQLADESGEALPDLLITDISGELFERLRDENQLIGSIPILARTDYLCFAIDGEALAGSARHAAWADARMTYRSIEASGVLPPDAKLQIAITKWDRIAGEEASIEHSERQSKALASLMTQNHRKVQSFRTAARSNDPSIESRTGLVDLLNAWAADIGMWQAPVDVPPPRAATREIESAPEGANGS